MIGRISLDEFHFVVTTSSPSAASQVLNSLRWVVFPDPSGPSKATSNPRRRDRSSKCERASRRNFWSREVADTLGRWGRQMIPRDFAQPAVPGTAQTLFTQNGDQ